jgi:pimeloyl-ACP methyl ester carboxylesterase
MSTVLLNGHPTWARVAKKRAPTLVLLHGGMSSSASLLRSIGPGLAKFYRIAAFDRRGHGRTADTAEPFHYDTMAEETVAFLEYLGRPAHLVGHSDGAITALLVAMRRPDLVRRVVAVGANYHYSALREAPEFPMEGPDFERWAKRYGATSPDGGDHGAHAGDVERRRAVRARPRLLDVRGDSRGRVGDRAGYVALDAQGAHRRLRARHPPLPDVALAPGDRVAHSPVDVHLAGGCPSPKEG